MYSGTLITYITYLSLSVSDTGVKVLWSSSFRPVADVNLNLKHADENQLKNCSMHDPLSMLKIELSELGDTQ